MKHFCPILPLNQPDSEQAPTFPFLQSNGLAAIPRSRQLVERTYVDQQSSLRTRIGRRDSPAPEPTANDFLTTNEGPLHGDPHSQPHRAPNIPRNAVTPSSVNRPSANNQRPRPIHRRQPPLRPAPSLQNPRGPATGTLVDRLPGGFVIVGFSKILVHFH